MRTGRERAGGAAQEVGWTTMRRSESNDRRDICREVCGSQGLTLLLVASIEPRRTTWSAMSTHLESIHLARHAQ